MSFFRKVTIDRFIFIDSANRIKWFLLKTSLWIWKLSDDKTGIGRKSFTIFKTKNSVQWNYNFILRWKKTFCIIELKTSSAYCLFLVQWYSCSKELNRLINFHLSKNFRSPVTSSYSQLDSFERYFFHHEVKYFINYFNIQMWNLSRRDKFCYNRCQISLQSKNIRLIIWWGCRYSAWYRCRYSA